MILRRTDSLIARTVLGAIAIVWLLLIGFDVVSVFATEVAQLGRGEYTLGAAILSLAWTLPRRAYDMYGTAAVIGSVLGLGSLAASAEITAMRAGGLSKARISFAALAAIGAVLALVVVAGETIAPFGEQVSRSLEAGAKSKDLVATGKTGLWAREGNTLINAKGGKSGATGVELSGVRVFEFGAEGELIQITAAQRAAKLEDQWHLYDLTRQHFTGKEIVSQTAKDEPWKVALDRSVLEFTIIRPEHLATRDLSAGIDYMRRNKLDAGEFLSAYWQRIFYPLEVLLLAACTLPFAFGAMRSGGFGRRLMVGVVLAISWYFFQRGLANVAGVYNIDHRLAHALPALLLAIVATVYFRRNA